MLNKEGRVETRPVDLKPAFIYLCKTCLTEKKLFFGLSALF